MFSISNHDIKYILFIKIFFLIANYVISIYLIRLYTIKFNKNIFLILTLYFIAFISIFNSLNNEFGAIKFLFFINNLPLSIFTFLIFSDSEFLEKFINLLLIISIPLIILTFFVNPFDTTSIYQFSVTRWSHVFFSRFIAFTILTTLIFHKKHNYLLLFLLILGLLYTGAKGPLLFVLVYLIIYSLTNINENSKTILIILFFSLIFFILFFMNESNQRILQLININNLLKSDGVLTRLEAWKLSLKIFQDNLLFGIGLGGFNSDFFGVIGSELKYSHNIFLEVMCELGLTGFILILIIFYKNFYYLIFNLPKVNYMFIFAFFLALFSKDLSSNPFLFSFLFFYFKSSTSGILKNNVLKSTYEVSNVS